METRVSTLDTLGQRLREVRRQRGLSQEKLAQPEFTKSYVSAVERGKARPSLKALELMARRLEMPMNELLNAPVTPSDEPSPETVATNLSYELDYARIEIDQHHATDALSRINAAETAAARYLEQLEPHTRYQIHYLRALAYLRLAEPASARQELTEALRVAAQMPDGAEDQERARNAMGVAYYQQDMPRLALEQHQLCAQAVDEGVVRDPMLLQEIYRNLADDHWALNEVEQAITVYQQALGQLGETGNLEQQAGLYRELSASYHTAGTPERARQYADKALAAAEIGQSLTTVAEMNVSLARILTGQREYAEAESLLVRARDLLGLTGNRLLLSTIAEQQAALEMERGDLERAAAYAEESVSLGEAVLGQHGEGTDPQTRTAAVRAYTQALRIAALVAERRNRPADADRIFDRALTLAGEAMAEELVSDLELTYAELLVARGEHEQASNHYRAAFRHRQRPAPR